MKIKKELSNKFEWHGIEATKEKEKGRAKGGIVMAVSKELKNVKVRIINMEIMEASLVHRRKKWRITILYSQNIKC